MTLLLLGLIPLRPDSTGLLNAVVFISQVASTLVMLPLGGLIAHTVSDDMKGRAAGWYQAGNLGGNGIGGGAGVWLAAHYSKEVAAMVDLVLDVRLRTRSLFCIRCSPCCDRNVRPTDAIPRPGSARDRSVRVAALHHRVGLLTYWRGRHE